MHFHVSKRIFPLLKPPYANSTKVDGPLNNGTAQMHMVKPRGHHDYEYKYLYVEVKGHERIYLENADVSGGSGKKQLSLFGVKW